MKASILRKITQFLPFPGRILRKFMKNYQETVTYPQMPVVVSAKGGAGLFEIRNPQELVQQSIYFLGYVEFRETKLIKHLLRPGDVFVDVGANIGWYTILGAYLVGSKGKVIACEPSSKIYEHLSKNVEINSLKNVRLEKIALSNQNGKAILDGFTEANLGLGTIIQTNQILTDSAEEIETKRYDDYFPNELERVRLLKIDVEGAEMMVLQGMRESLEAKVFDYIIIEIVDDRLRDRANTSANEVLGFLRNFGYSLFKIGLFQIQPLGENEKVSVANILAKGEA